MKYLRNILIVLIVLITIVFIVQNYEGFSQKFEIGLNLYIDAISFKTPPIQGWIIFLGSFFFGVVLASIGGLMERIRLKGELRQAKKEIDRLKEELNSLRNLPITEEPVPTKVMEEEPAAPPADMEP